MGGSSFDYVIVGAGSAGCVLASRLSEDPGVRVMLLEAGPPDDRPELHVPLAWLGLNHADTDWDFVSAPEPGCNGRRLTLARGKTLGGSSSVNAMIYMRGAPADFDAWGIEGWRWDDLLPSFIRAEDNERGSNEWHGTGGPLGVSDGHSRDPLMAAFIAASAEAGEPLNSDFNGTSQMGAGWFQVTQRDGARCSTADAYLSPLSGRPNVTIVTYAQATRIEMDGTRATGVEYVRFGERHVARAEREVILSAGTYGSPHLLMVSGIGPADHLRSRGVTVACDHPDVGGHLSDHPAVALSWSSTEEGSLWGAFGKMDEYLTTKRGPLSSNGTEAGAFLAVDGGDLPDIQIHALAVPLLGEGTTDPTRPGFALAPCLLQPLARGSVRLASAHPLTKPIIRCGYWQNETDMRVMVAGIRRTLEISDQPSLREIIIDGTEVPENRDDSTLRAFVARNTFAFFHAAGTCGLGRVVDSQLRVMGVDGLRVADASVIPVVPRGNPNAVVIAIAERAADLIRAGLTVS